MKIKYTPLPLVQALMLALVLACGASLRAQTSCDTIDQFPWSDDLDSYVGTTNTALSDNNLPACWSFQNTGATSSGHPLLYQSASYAHSGLNCLRFYMTTGSNYSNQTAILPPMQQVGSLTFTFHARCGSTNHIANARLAIGVWEGPSQYTWIDTVQVTSVSYQPFEVSLAGYTGLGHQIAISSLQPASGWSQIFVDDLEVMPLNSCPRPHDVALTEVHSSSLSVSWMGESDNGWNVLVSDSLVTDFTSAVAQTTFDTFFTATGLAPSTTYYVYLQTDCGDGLSYWTSPLSATTMCAPIAAAAMPYQYGFEDATASGSAGTINPCWTLATNYSSGGYPQPYAQGARTGSYGLRFMGYTSSYSYAVLPPFESAPRQLKLTFWSRSSSASYSGELQVGIMTNPNDINTFQPVVTCTPNGANWTEHTVGFTAFAGEEGCIAIVMPAPGGYNYAYIDDLTVDTIECPTPTLWVDTESSTELALSWLPEIDGAVWSVEYQSPADDDWWANSTSSNMFLLDGLEPSTAYQLRVGYLCNDSVIYGYASAVTLEAPRLCLPPEDIEVINITRNSADLQWTEASALAVDNYLVEYGVAGFTRGQGTTVTATGSGVSLTGLSHSTPYDVYITAACEGNDTSLSALVSFATECTTIDSLPYLMTFDDLGAPAVERTGMMPNCWAWQRLNNTTMQDSLPHLRYNAIYAASGAYTLCLPYLCLVTLPAIDATLEMADLRLSFSDYVSTSAYGLIVGVCDSNTAGCEASFSPIDTLFFAEAGRHDVTLYLASYHGQGRYIAFRNYHATANYSYHYLDNILLEAVPGCLPVVNLASLGNTDSTVTLRWDDLREGGVWQVSVGSSADHTPVADTTVFSNPAIVEGLTPGQPLYFWVRSICGEGDTGDWTGPLCVTPGSYVMRANRVDSLYLCSGLIYDDGGSNGDYSANQNSTLILYPDTEGSLLQISGTCYLEEAEADQLYIYEGAGTQGALLWQWTGNTGNGSIPLCLSTTGPLTIVFVPDYMLQYAGFELSVSCTTITCPVVVDLAAAVSPNSATLTWTPGGDEEQWEVAFGTASNYSTTSPTYTLTGLTPGQDYTARVRPICGDGDTGMWRSIGFTTECDVVSAFPWAENFNAYAGTNYGTAGPQPHCWLTHSNSSNSDYEPHVVSSGNYAFSPDNSPSLCMTSGSSAYGSLKYVALPQFNRPLEDLTLSFWYQTEDYTHGTLSVGYFLTDSLAESFVAVRDLANDSLGRYDTIAFDTLNGLPTAAVRIGFRWGYPTSFYTVCLDNLAVQAVYIPTCDEPTIDSVYAIDHQSATVAWTGQGESYEVELTTDEPFADTPLSVQGTTLTLTDLQPLTDYHLRIRQDCDSIGYSDWVYATFTTDSLPCQTPTDLALVDLGGTTATLSWTPQGEETSWQVRYGSRGDTLVATFSAPTGTLSSLLNQAEYSAQVRALCGEGDHVSPWSDPVGFTTIPCDTATGLTVQPASTSAILTWWTSDAQAWKVYYGLTNVAAGMDSLRVSTPTCELTGLQPDMTYYIILVAYCADDWVSNQTYPIAFTTTPLGIEAAVAPEVSLYPNPAHSQVMVQGYDGPVMVVDMAGRVALRSAGSSFDVSSLAPGCYFVKLGQLVRKLMVE